MTPIMAATSSMARCAEACARGGTPRHTLRPIGFGYARARPCRHPTDGLRMAGILVKSRRAMQTPETGVPIEESSVWTPG